VVLQTPVGTPAVEQAVPGGRCAPGVQTGIPVPHEMVPGLQGSLPHAAPGEQGLQCEVASQTPATPPVAVHVVPTGAGPLSMHVALPLLHTVVPTRQVVPGGTHAEPGVQGWQPPMPSQKSDAPHMVPAGTGMTRTHACVVGSHEVGPMQIMSGGVIGHVRVAEHVNKQVGSHPLPGALVPLSQSSPGSTW
jgi:hypothetical protein